MPATYRIVIMGWRPAYANELMSGHWAKAGRLKAKDAHQLTVAKLVNKIPDATGKRRLSLTISRNKGRVPDADAPLKSFLDAAKRSGLIIDDSRDWCEWTPAQFVTGPPGTVIVIEDL